MMLSLQAIPAVTMLARPEIWIGLAGVCAGLFLLSSLVWSIVFPEQRFWPPVRATTSLKLKVWLSTIAIFSSAFGLGVLDWNTLGVPASYRWGVGLPLVLAGNLVVWRGVFEIGMRATSGEVNELRTGGLYRWSRNPQYLADIVILAGWGVLSASIWALPIIVLGWLTLLVAPFAEEPWLERVYGDEYRGYKTAVRRFF